MDHSVEIFSVSLKALHEEKLITGPTMKIQFQMILMEQPPVTPLPKCQMFDNTFHTTDASYGFLGFKMKIYSLPGIKFIL